MWEIKNTETFHEWFKTQEISVKEDIVTAVRVLSEFGPRLGRPRVDSLKASRHPNMKELRVQSGGKPFRILFAFDPKRTGILLVAGNKKGDKRFYEKMIPIADNLFDEYLEDNNE